MNVILHQQPSRLVVQLYKYYGLTGVTLFLLNRHMKTKQLQWEIPNQLERGGGGRNGCAVLFKYVGALCLQSFCLVENRKEKLWGRKNIFFWGSLIFIFKLKGK